MGSNKKMIEDPSKMDKMGNEKIFFMTEKTPTILEHVISLVEMVRSCCHVYVPEAMVGTLTFILV